MEMCHLSSTSRESVCRKRELCIILGESAASKDGTRATTTSEPEDDGDGDIYTMDPERVVVHRGSQCNILFPSFIRSPAATKLESSCQEGTGERCSTIVTSASAFSLESYHSLILHFAPKHTGFSFLGMYSSYASFPHTTSRPLATNRHTQSDYGTYFRTQTRRCPATLELQEDIQRPLATNRHNAVFRRPVLSNMRIDIYRDKNKTNQAWKEICEEFGLPGYATNLMVSLVEEYSRSPQALQRSSAVLSSAAPPPLTTSLQKIAKDEAVSLHLARHLRFNM
ncbi:unnamed protein product [Boreogadus saida]